MIGLVIAVSLFFVTVVVMTVAVMIYCVKKRRGGV
jgi:hypothetical protein